MNDQKFIQCDNKYCKMTTIDMLKKSKTCYEVAHAKLQTQLDIITSKHYTSSIDIPPDVCEKITNLNIDIQRIEDVIDSITQAISVIEVEI